MTPQALADTVEKEFLTAFAATTPATLLNGTRLGWTKYIKQLMGNLGKRLKFGVAASGYPGASQGEFLYDMMWFNLANGFVTDQPMVMEVEYKPSPVHVVDDDFQKLVQARAHVRVWVNTCANIKDVDVHVDNCARQIGIFDQSITGDQYVLVFFEWGTRTCVVRRLTATPASTL